MADHTHIEWTDATWNPVTGCTLVSEGCRNCYAAELAAGRLRNHPSRQGLARRNAAGVAAFTGEVRFNEQWLDQPLHWTKPRRIFVAAHGDLFHESVPDAWIDRVFAVMALAPRHIFQVLTKRPERMREWFFRRRGQYSNGAQLAVYAALAGYGSMPRPRGFGATSTGTALCMRELIQPSGWPLPNVWLGTSVEDQATADERIPHLLETPAAVRFLSAEPLLAPIRIAPWLHDSDCRIITTPYDGCTCCEPSEVALDWVICGGESGPRARPMDAAWAESLRDQCRAAGVAFFMKQMTKKAKIPADLLVREFPDAR